MNTEVTDVSEYYPEAIRAERKGANVLILYSGNTPETYELSYHWLTRQNAELCEVQGSELSFWNQDELNPKVSLFGQVNLF